MWSAGMGADGRFFWGRRQIFLTCRPLFERKEHWNPTDGCFLHHSEHTSVLGYAPQRIYSNVEDYIVSNQRWWSIFQLTTILISTDYSAIDFNCRDMTGSIISWQRIWVEPLVSWWISRQHCMVDFSWRQVFWWWKKIPRAFCTEEDRAEVEERSCHPLRKLRLLHEVLVVFMTMMRWYWGVSMPRIVE